MELDSMTFTRKTGFEEIISENKTANVLDFWRWAFSDLVGNTERGTFAEYLVALACNVDKNIRISWNAYDLDLENGIKVEIKSSAYIQTWKQSKLSTPIFKINKTFSWDYIENKYDTVKKRHADIYVFALLSHQDKKTINPLDTNQWDFFIVNKEELDDKMGDAKQISLKQLLKLSLKKSNFEDLNNNINRCFVSLRKK